MARAKKKTPAAASPPPRRLVRVRTPRTLLYREDVCKEPMDRIWARSGAVIDLTAPEVAELARGQEYKLEPIDEEAFGAAAADGREWTPEAASPRVQRHLRDRAAQLAGPSETVPTPVRSAPPPQAAGVGGARGVVDTGAKAAPSAPPEPAAPEAPRRAADVEAAIADEEAGE